MHWFRNGYTSALTAETGPWVVVCSLSFLSSFMATQLHNWSGAARIHWYHIKQISNYTAMGRSSPPPPPPALPLDLHWWVAAPSSKSKSLVLLSGTMWEFVLFLVPVNNYGMQTVSIAEGVGNDPNHCIIFLWANRPCISKNYLFSIPFFLNHCCDQNQTVKSSFLQVLRYTISSLLVYSLQL